MEKVPYAVFGSKWGEKREGKEKKRGKGRKRWRRINFNFPFSFINEPHNTQDGLKGKAWRRLSLHIELWKAPKLKMSLNPRIQRRLQWVTLVVVINIIITAILTSSLKMHCQEGLSAKNTRKLFLAKRLVELATLSPYKVIRR